MIQIDETALTKLTTASEHFDTEYGLKGTPEREAFEDRANQWYYNELLKEERKRTKNTKKQLEECIEEFS